MAKPKPKGATPQQSPPPRPPLEATPTAKFKKDVERQKRRGKDTTELRRIIEALCDHQSLDVKYRDHALTGDWKGWRDCHVEPDWVLIYKRGAKTLVLGRTGSHSDLGF